MGCIQPHKLIYFVPINYVSIFTHTESIHTIKGTVNSQLSITSSTSEDQEQYEKKEY